jgi:cytochrome c5
MTLRNLALLGLGALLAAGACGDDSADADSDCPAELSYAKTAEPFLEAYCLACHSEKSAAAVGDGHIFATEALVREHGESMYEQVLSGAMPKGGAKPSDDEKRNFLEWLECSGATAEGAGHDHDHGK